MYNFAGIQRFVIGVKVLTCSRFEKSVVLYFFTFFFFLTRSIVFSNYILLFYFVYFCWQIVLPEFRGLANIVCRFVVNFQTQGYITYIMAGVITQSPKKIHGFKTAYYPVD